ncbi:MAG TPA: uroporphyrinogen-III synthase [Paracoccaceae bacterium]|nr:uroporphyrinogen-III synthase [Paracoccaceae bacterium]
MPRFLMTRPAVQGARFAADLRAAFPGARVTHSPLMAPEFRVPDLPEGGFAALVLTSETAVQGFRRLSAEMRAALPRMAWCVGDRTARAARAAGLRAWSAQGDAGALVALVQGARPEGRLLYLHGADLRGDVAERLSSAGIETFSALIYDQRPQPLTPAARRLLAGRAPVIVPLFSPRTADLLAAQAPLRAPLWVAALSPAVAQAAAALRPERMATAERPDAPALIAAIGALIAAGPDA